MVDPWLNNGVSSICIGFFAVDASAVCVKRREKLFAQEKYAVIKI